MDKYASYFHICATTLLLALIVSSVFVILSNTIHAQDSEILVSNLQKCQQEDISVKTNLTPQEVHTLLGKTHNFSTDECRILSLYSTFTTIRAFLFFIGGAITVMFLLVGGYLYITSRGDPNKTKKSKTTLIAALVGFIILLIAIPFLQVVSAIIGVNTSDTVSTVIPSTRDPSDLDRKPPAPPTQQPEMQPQTPTPTPEPEEEPEEDTSTDTTPEPDEQTETDADEQEPDTDTTPEEDDGSVTPSRTCTVQCGNPETTPCNEPVRCTQPTTECIGGQQCSTLPCGLGTLNCSTETSTTDEYIPPRIEDLKVRQFITGSINVAWTPPDPENCCDSYVIRYKTPNTTDWNTTLTYYTSAVLRNADPNNYNIQLRVGSDYTYYIQVKGLYTKIQSGSTSITKRVEGEWSNVAVATRPSTPEGFLFKNVVENAKQQGRGHCFEQQLYGELDEAIRIIGNNMYVPFHLCVEVREGTEHSTAAGLYGAGKVTILNLPQYQKRSREEREKRLRQIMIHELCHAQQHYHSITHGVREWYNSPAGKDFIEIVGFDESNGSYFKPNESNTRFHGYTYYGYGNTRGSNPVEFAAEVCKIFFLHKAGFEYDAPVWNLVANYGLFNNFGYIESQLNAILNYQPLRDWFNQYINVGEPIPEAPEQEDTTTTSPSTITRSNIQETIEKIWRSSKIPTEDKYRLDTVLKQVDQGECYQQIDGEIDAVRSIIRNQMLVPLNLCIISIPAEKSARLGGSYSNGRVAMQGWDAFTESVKPNTAPRIQSVLIHELCHANQDLHEQYANARTSLNTINLYGPSYSEFRYVATRSGQEFIRITEYVLDNNGRYRKPADSDLPFHEYNYYGYGATGIGGSIPIEFAAEVCTFFLLDQFGLKDGQYSEEAANAILTHQPLRDWFNKYVVKTP